MPAVARRVPTAILFAALLCFAPATARAADPPKPAETALGKVPADAEFFRSALRMGETIQTIGKTRAWKLVWNDPDVQEAWKKIKEGYATDPENKARKFFADPANADLPALAADAFSNEMFVYVGGGAGDLIALFQEVVGGARYAPAIGKLLGEDAGDPARAKARAALLALSEKPERIRIPDLVIGFKVSDPAKVAAQLKRLDPVVADALKDTQLAGRSKRVKVADDEFLALELDGSLVPWGMIPIKQYEDKEGEFDPLIKHLKGMKLSVAVGVRQGYLLVAVGESAQHLAKFGGPGPKLAGRLEFEPLAKVAGKPITAISYTAAKLRQATATTPEDVAGYAELAKAGLEKADLPEDLRKTIEKDIDALAQAYARGLKKPGAAVSASYRTARGWETFDYDFTAPGPAEPRPLTLLNHVGGSPLLAAVWRSGTTVEDYRTLVKWITMFGKDAEKAILAKSPDAGPIVMTFQTEIVPLLKDLSDTTEKLWLPALADGQEGFVIDAKWVSRKWHESFPADRELPLPELGVVLGVSDPGKLVQALEGYRTVLNKLIAKARELDPSGTVPEFEIPKPKVEKKGGRTFAYYLIPEEWGIDKQFRPTGGLSDKVAALTLSQGHTERLLNSAPLTTGLAPFADLNRPLESAFYLNWAGFVDAAGPWVGYLITKAELGEDQAKAERIARRVMQALKVFRAYGSATYREGGATVTHSETVFGDIDSEPGK